MSTFVDLGSLLLVRGADEVEHAGGSLYVHLHRVAKRLARLGASDQLVLVGLAHAAYGTDGFRIPLFDWRTERSVLEAVIGPAAEAQIYRYCSCDRESTWQDLAEHHIIVDRFTGASEEVDRDDLRDFVDLCIVNELDVLDHAPRLAPTLESSLRELVPRWQALASPAVAAEAERVLQLSRNQTPA